MFALMKTQEKSKNEEKGRFRCTNFLHFKFSGFGTSKSDVQAKLKNMDDYLNQIIACLYAYDHGSSHVYLDIYLDQSIEGDV